jgi:hypothetical protein
VRADAVLLRERHGFVHYGEVARVEPTGDVRWVDGLQEDFVVCL